MPRDRAADERMLGVELSRLSRMPRGPGANGVCCGS